MSQPSVNYRQIIAAEIFGTFSLIFAGTGAVVVNTVTGGTITHAGVAIVWGLIVMAMIYAIGHISGAHMNSAVTIGFCLAGRLKWSLAPVYLIAQAIGAFAASAALLGIFGNHGNLGATLPAGSAMQSFALEFILTFILMYVVLLVSTGPKETGILAGIAIGGIIGLEAMFAGPICGASMNPIRSLAPALVSGNTNALWVYLSAPVLGAALAVIIWKFIHPAPSVSIPSTSTGELP